MHNTLVGAFAFQLSVTCLAVCRDSPNFTVLYTCDTQGMLQPCGCQPAQFGGVARRATLLQREGIGRGAVFAIDGGNLAQDRERALVVLRCLKVIGYDAVALTAADESLGQEFVSEGSKLEVPLIGTLRGCTPLIVRQVGNLRVGVTRLRGSVEQTLAHMKNAMTMADRKGLRVLIVSSECGEGVDRLVAEAIPVGQVEVLLFSRGLADSATIGKTHLVPAPKGGYAISRTSLTWEGKKLNIKSTLVSIPDDVKEDESVRAIVEQYYAELSKQLFVKAATEPAEGLTQRYASLNQCQECHPSVVHPVSRQRHSHAVETLKSKERLVPECLSCHSELYRRTKRWRPDDPLAWNGVECATCHGDGVIHSQIGTKETITRKSPEALCRSCHTPERDPAFNYAKRLEGIRHWK